MPIAGYDENERFDQAYSLTNVLKEAFANAEIITPFHCCPRGCKIPYGKCMKRCIKELIKSDMIIFADDWEKSKDCLTELEIAKSCEIEHYTFAQISKKDESKH